LSKYEMDDQEIVVRFTAKVGDFCRLHSIRTGSGAHPASYPVGTGFPPGIKRLKREANYSLSSSVEVKNAGTYVFTASIRLHGLEPN
jgi:hypothetical protein